MSSHNPRVQRLRRLARQRRDRADERAFVIEGNALVADALDAGIGVEAVFAEARAADSLLARADAAGVTVYEVAEGVLAGSVTTSTPQPVAAIARWCDVALEDVLAADLLLVLIGVSDPGNAGTLLRTAEAAGVGAVLFCEGSVDPFNPKCVRASAGSIFHVPVVSGGEPVQVLQRLGGGERRRVGTDAHRGEPYDRVDLTAPLALVLGSEAHGLAPALVPYIDLVVTIPMAGRIESLNVGMAGSIICFEASRQRRERGTAETAP